MPASNSTEGVSTISSNFVLSTEQRTEACSCSRGGKTDDFSWDDENTLKNGCNDVLELHDGSASFESGSVFQNFSKGRDIQTEFPNSSAPSSSVTLYSGDLCIPSCSCPRCEHRPTQIQVPLNHRTLSSLKTVPIHTVSDLVDFSTDQVHYEPICSSGYPWSYCTDKELLFCVVDWICLKIQELKPSSFWMGALSSWIISWLSSRHSKAPSFHMKFISVTAIFATILVLKISMQKKNVMKTKNLSRLLTISRYIYRLFMSPKWNFP